jgi:hypothetical protein
MAHTELEVLAAASGDHAGTAPWKCSSCTATGEFASDSSDEQGNLPMTSFFDALAANLQEAGYEVEMYSQEFVPRILNRLVKQCLAKDRGKRPASARDIVLELGRSC